MKRVRFLVTYFGIVAALALTLLAAFPTRSRPPVGNESSRVREAELTRGLLTPARHYAPQGKYLYVCDACDLASKSKGACPNCGQAFERVLRTQVSYACESCSVKSDEPGSCGSCGRDLAMVLTRPERDS